MSGYNYYPDQNNYHSNNNTQYPATPQYTQSQINQYYAQYQCYPPQPFQIIPDYYVQPASVPQNTYQPMESAQLGYGEWQPQASQYSTQHQIPLQDPPRSNSQTKTWTCDITGCTSNAQFTRLADLQRHQSTVHGMGTPEFPCTVPRCSRVGDKGFTRRDHLIEHLRSFHQLDIPKRKPGERSAFPFGWPEGYQSASGSKSR